MAGGRGNRKGKAPANAEPSYELHSENEAPVHETPVLHLGSSSRHLNLLSGRQRSRNRGARLSILEEQIGGVANRFGGVDRRLERQDGKLDEITALLNNLVRPQPILETNPEPQPPQQSSHPPRSLSNHPRPDEDEVASRPSGSRVRAAMELHSNDLRHKIEERRSARASQDQGWMDDNITPLEAELRELRERIGDIQRAQLARAPTAADVLVDSSESPFTDEIRSEPLPKSFKIPQLKQYTGIGDPAEHLENFKVRMELHGANGHIMCKAFPLSLTSSAWTWFRNLKPRSISSFAELSRAFATQFIGSTDPRKHSTHLAAVKQKDNESLKDYLSRFNAEAVQVENLSQDVLLHTMIGGLRDEKFLWSIGEQPPQSVAEFLDRAAKHINAEELVNAQGSSHKRKDRKEENSAKRHRPDRRSPNSNTVPRGAKTSVPKFEKYTPLKTTIEQIFLAEKNRQAFGRPAKIKTDPDRRSKSKYCLYHKDHGHNTVDCFDLKRQIETLIR